MPKFGDLISPKDHVKIGRAVVETRAAQKLDKAEREAKERAMALQEKEMLDNLQQWWGQVD